MNRITKILMIVSAVVAALIGVLMMHGCATTKAKALAATVSQP